MMDPEMFRLAQEQMSRIPPDQLMKMQQQMINNPELFRMAMEGMKNIKSEDLRFAAEQMKHMRSEDMAEMSSQMANASAEELSAIRAQAEAHQNYEFQGALMLKNQGNSLHGIGNYYEAAEKYKRAKQNLFGICKPEAANLKRSCSLNLMSCYLKTKQYDNVVTEGIEILEADPKNLKALYRRGQAYKELGELKLAYKDLKMAAEIDPDDETVQGVLRNLKVELESWGQEPNEDAAEGPPERQTNGPLIEEIVECGTESLDECKQDDVLLCAPAFDNQPHVSETIESLRHNPEMVKSMFSMMGSLRPEQIASMSGGHINAEMAKLASEMMKHMSSEDIQRMMDTMPTLQRPSSLATSVDPGLTTSSEPSLLDMPTSSQAPASSDSTGSQKLCAPNLGTEVQEQMRQQMKDPAMKEMMASMLRTMTPETMMSMSEQMGIRLSPEEAQRAQTAMSKFSPDEIEKMMRWADRLQRLWDYLRKTKDFLLGKPGLLLALIILFIAVILHLWGIIGG